MVQFIPSFFFMLTCIASRSFVVCIQLGDLTEYFSWDATDIEMVYSTSAQNPPKKKKIREETGTN